MVSGGRPYSSRSLAGNRSPNGEDRAERDRGHGCVPRGEEVGALLGLVTGFEIGDNVIRVSSGGASPHSTELKVTNHPPWGPVFAGPHEQPFFCTGDLFPARGGGTLGPPLDEHCSAERRVDYVLPHERGHHQTAACPGPPPRGCHLHDHHGRTSSPVDRAYRDRDGEPRDLRVRDLTRPREPLPDPWHPSVGWNGKLIYRFGGGCRPGWYQQGSRTAGCSTTTSSLGIPGSRPHP